jgi:hypothetical protein
MNSLQVHADSANALLSLLPDQTNLFLFNLKNNAEVHDFMTACSGPRIAKDGMPSLKLYRQPVTSLKSRLCTLPKAYRPVSINLLICNYRSMPVKWL